MNKNSSILLSFLTLYIKEISRFLIFPAQTLSGPVILGVLLMYTLSLSLKNSVDISYIVEFQKFLIPGIIIMQVVQAGFFNTTSSLIASKLYGSLNAVIAAPISIGVLILSYVLGAATRGLLIMVVLLILFKLWLSVPLSTIHWVHFLYSILVSGSIMALLGMLVGIICDRFDTISLYTNFIIMPLSMLSGTLYSTDKLPPMIQQINQYNPIFIMVDSARNAFLGTEVNYYFSLYIYLSIVLIILYAICYFLLKSGYKIKP